MKNLLLTIGVIAASVTIVVGAASAARTSPSPSARISLASTGLGRILVDGHGRTLYLFAKDKNGKSLCTGSCATYWPPLIASGKPIAVKGAKASLLGTTRRSDGRRQVTYRNHPLYKYVGDTGKGQTAGQGLNLSGGLWWVLSPAGKKIVTGGSTGSGGY